MLWVRVNGRSVLYVRQGHCHGLPQMEARESLGRKVGVVCGNGPSYAAKYSISSDPPLNACLARLFGKMDITCVSGGVGCMFYCSYSGGVSRAPSSSYPIPDEAPPSRLRGCGQKEEVKLRGGVCRLRKEGGASGFERAKGDLVREKGFSLGKQSLSRRARVSKRANEGGTVLDLPGETLNLSAPSLHFWQ